MPSELCACCMYCYDMLSVEQCIGHCFQKVVAKVIHVYYSRFGETGKAKSGRQVTACEILPVCNYR